jgi:hypothetical protein
MVRTHVGYFMSGDDFAVSMICQVVRLKGRIYASSA